MEETQRFTLGQKLSFELLYSDILFFFFRSIISTPIDLHPSTPTPPTPPPLYPRRWPSIISVHYSAGPLLQEQLRFTLPAPSVAPPVFLMRPT